jgi:putative SOS response-associated peptidase YedK
VPANRLLAEIHNEKQRMPALLAEQDHDTWLSGAREQAKAALRPYPDELMVAWKVSRRVNNPRLPNDATLIEPLGG